MVHLKIHLISPGCPQRSITLHLTNIMAKRTIYLISFTADEITRMNVTEADDNSTYIVMGSSEHREIWMIRLREVGDVFIDGSFM